MHRKKKLRIAIAAFAVLFTAYAVFVYFLVSACLVPSFMDKLNAFEDITEKCYSEQIQTADIKENRSQLLSGTQEWLEKAERKKIQVRTADGYLLTAAEFPAETGDAGSTGGKASTGSTGSAESTESAGDKWALLLHGYTGWKEEMYQFACWYHQQGYSVLVPDLRCQGESEGDFIGMGWTDHYDCELWIAHILEQAPEAQIVLHGQSMGAATALLMAGSPGVSEHIKAVVSDSAYTSGYEMFGDKITEWFHLPAAPFVDSACVMLRLRGGYNLRDASPLRAVAASRIPTLFIHGDEDRMIDVNMSYELFEAAACEKELFIVEGAGHAQAQDKAPDAYYGRISEFLGRYL
ncbi:MAG: alpha/beta hydrolase [Lachnospiraceae bacterium]|nr:alpha/beta hydrolase [Lachnospiraceae bacterium]